MLPEETTVGLIGLGSVGGALLPLLHEAGFRTVAVELDPDRAHHWRNITTVGSDVAALRDADVVVECLPEDYAHKAFVYRQLAVSVDPAAVLVSTTAHLSLSALATTSERPGQLVGWRMLVPPSQTTAVEVVSTTMTDPQAAKTAEQLLEALRIPRTHFRCHEVASDLVLASLNRAVALADTGYASAEDVDRAMRLGCGLPIGPFALLNRLGLDTAHRRLADLASRSGFPSHTPAEGLTTLVTAGKHGAKSRSGFLAHDPGATAADGPEPARHPAVTRLAVVGSGLMARGICQTAALAGIGTVLLARNAAKAAAAVEAVGASLARAVRRGRITPSDRQEALARIDATDDWSALAGCEVAVEAVAEDAEIKRAVFAEMDRHAAPEAVLATTTSSLAVRLCAAATGRAHNVVGIHFFNPVPAIELVEVGFTGDTSESAIRTAVALAGQLGKKPVLCRDEPGFLVNFLLFPYLHDAALLVERGVVDVDDLDHDVTQGYGYPMGPFSLMDTIGLDVSVAIQNRLFASGRAPEVRPTAMLSRLARLGHLGRKSGSGFYRHPKASGGTGPA